MIVDVIKDPNIFNPDMLSLAAKIAKHVEKIVLYLNFSDDFKLEDVPDDVVINLLDNIDSRL